MEIMHFTLFPKNYGNEFQIIFIGPISSFRLQLHTFIVNLFHILLYYYFEKKRLLVVVS